MSWSDTEKNKLRRENEQLRAELTAARKVADAAVAREVANNAPGRLSNVRRCDPGYPAYQDAMMILFAAEGYASDALDFAVSEYRALTESQEVGG